MAVKVTSNIMKKFKGGISQVMDSTTKNSIFNMLKMQIIMHCRAGLSPVLGQGRFKKYKDTDKYPGLVMEDHPGKTKSPVNLSLTGEMLDSIELLDSRRGIKIGITNVNTLDRAIAHNFGKGNVPRRAFLPARGLFGFGAESFNQSIMRMITDMFNARIKNLLNKGD